MTESRARRDLDFDYALDDPDDNNGWYGQAQVGDATVMHDVGELERDDPPETWQDDPDTDSWYVPAQETEVAPVPAADDVDDPRLNGAYDKKRCVRQGVGRTPRHPVRPPVRATQRTQRHPANRRVDVRRVQARALVPQQAAQDRPHRGGRGGDRRATRRPRGAQSCDRRRGVHTRAVESADQRPTGPDQRCTGPFHPTAVATGTTAPSAAATTAASSS